MTAAKLDHISQYTFPSVFLAVPRYAVVCREHGRCQLRRSVMEPKYNLGTLLYTVVRKGAPASNVRGGMGLPAGAFAVGTHGDLVSGRNHA